MRKCPANSLAFGLLGLGTSYTLSDTIFSNFATFMRCLPGGLLIPDEIYPLSTAVQAVTCIGWGLFTVLSGGPSMVNHVRLVWACLVAVLAVAVILAAAWRAVVGETAIVVLLASSTATTVGSLSWAAIIPFVSTHYPEELVSAFFTGSATGSLVAGGLGLVQAAAPAGFGPTPCFASLFVILTPSAVAWRWILRSGLARPSLRAAAGVSLQLQLELPGGASHSPPAGGTPHAHGCRPVMPSGPTSPGGQAPVRAPLRPPPLRPPPWLRASLPMWAIAMPMNFTTWGMSPALSNFAAAHAGCSCDPADPTVSTTYRVAISLSFFCMPLAGLLSYLRPIHSLRTLSSLAALQMASFCLVLCAAAEVGFMTCSAPARAALAASIVVMRSVDTFVTAMLYRVVAGRVAERCGPKGAERASIAFGQLLVMSTLVAALLATGLVTSGAIQCELAGPDASADAAKPASAALDVDLTDAVCS